MRGTLGVASLFLGYYNRELPRRRRCERSARLVPRSCWPARPRQRATPTARRTRPERYLRLRRPAAIVREFSIATLGGRIVTHGSTLAIGGTPGPPRPRCWDRRSITTRRSPAPGT